MSHLRFFCCAIIHLLLVYFISDFCLVDVRADEQNEFRFEGAIQQYEKADAVTPPPKGCTLFVGSSTFALWKTIPTDFKEIAGVNRGFGGSTIPEVNYVIDRIITPFEPASIVFFCGTNDIARGAKSGKAFADFQEFLKLLWEKRPDCNVFYMSATHAPVREKFWPEQDKLNDLIKEFATKTNHLYFIDVRPILDDETGKPKPEFFQEDKLHLTTKAHEAIAPLILKTVKEVTMTMTAPDSKAMQEKIDAAVSFYTQIPKEYNCAQAIAKGFGRDDLVESLKASGGGRAPDGICGALYAVMLMTPENKHAEIKQLFEQSVGNIHCKEIKAVEKTPCPECVRRAAVLYAKFVQ
ncbi:MAG: GDSL-type esterase/lipase family protein [Thermoguttaceae bacterium]